ncbi:MAG: DUF3078 domain-containing protein [Bacteroidales bacterium]|nr:DUF3078 domain-containing protein [Bacteroidales bacterium]
MKKTLTLTFVFLFAVGLALNAQDTLQAPKDWKIGGNASLTFGQTSLTNWSAGGVSSFSLNGQVNFHADYQKDKLLWTNNMIMAYGMYKEKDKDREKNDDRIDLVSNFGYEMVKHWYYSVTGGFKTQFDEGYPEDQDTLFNSNWFSPAYVTLGLGFTYKPNDNLQLILSPATYRLTIVNNQRLADHGEYGLDGADLDTAGMIIAGTGTHFRHELGFDLKFAYAVTLFKNIDFQTNLGLYSNYLEDPQNVDVYWDNYFNFTINSWLSAKLSTSLIYDHDIKIADENGVQGPKTQFKQTFGLGLVYKFGYQKE